MSYFSKGSFIGNVDNYANVPVPESYSKKVMTQTGANANLFINSRDRNTGTFGNPNIQAVNDFSITKGFPISQGQINSIIVSEVKIPTPPNITPRNDTMYAFAYDSAGNLLPAGIGSELKITIGDGTGEWYSGTQIAGEIENALQGWVGIGAPNNSTCTYTPGGYFRIAVDVAGATTYVNIGFAPSSVYALGATNVSQLPGLFSTYNINTQSLMSTIGMSFANNNWFSKAGIYTLSTNTYSVRTGIASLAYTEYIDIVSDVLTQYQELTDTSTDITNPRHIIARVYIADEISKASVDISGNPVLPGTIYTTIHRQFKNPKVIRWNGQNSVDRIDLRLYDDQGRLLFIPEFGQDDYQLTIMPVEL